MKLPKITLSSLGAAFGSFFIISVARAQVIRNPLGSNTGDDADPRVIIGRIIAGVLGIVGSLALAIFIYGGITWMTSAGNQDRVKKGKDMILWAVLGIAIIFFSYALVTFLLGVFYKPAEPGQEANNPDAAGQ